MDDPDAGILLRNLHEVFSERDAARRLAAIRAIYSDGAIFFEQDGQVEGWDALNAHIGALLDRLPAGFAFTPRGAVVRNHDLARAFWQLGPTGGPSVGTGTDVARIEGGKIRELYVFLDPPTP